VSRPARPGAAGFTLAELLIALAIVGALLTIAFGGLRVALGAWQQGESRTEAHQHVRSVAVVLGRAIGATYAYKGSFDETPDTRVLFRGEESRIEFVTQAPPAPFPIPIAFVAVVVSLEPEEGLVIRQRALPNLNPFSEAEVVLKDPGVTALAFQYLDEEQGWQSTYDNEQVPPRAVGITVTTTRNGQAEQLPPLTVPIRFPPE
jgi:prepilin-type N-terminal cleavage/methylation domain-containing protein